jgi:hypothetical protein
MRFCELSSDELERARPVCAATAGPVGDSECPYLDLLVSELRVIPRAAGMTKGQTVVWRLHFDNRLGVNQIARALNITPSAVSQRLSKAFERASRIQHLGALTVVVERFGWEGVQAAICGRI